jgi:uncharacterized membrane protein
MESYFELPQPDEISKTEREDAMGAYLMMFAALGAGLPLPMINLIASFVYYFLNRRKSRFVRFHVLQSLWSQLPVTLLNGFLVFWTIRIFVLQETFTQLWFGFLFAAFLANVVYIAFSIYAAVLARKGQFYYFLFFGKLAYHQVFKQSVVQESTVQVENKPPI